MQTAQQLIRSNASSDDFSNKGKDFNSFDVK